MGRNAARRAASSSTVTASSEAVSMVATKLGSLATTNSRLIDAISQRQRSIDYKIYMKPHRGLEGLELEATLEEKERKGMRGMIVDERYGVGRVVGKLMWQLMWQQVLVWGPNEVQIETCPTKDGKRITWRISIRQRVVTPLNENANYVRETDELRPCIKSQNWEMDHLFRAFKKYGPMVDVYVARKRLRNGKRFGFVRFHHNVNELALSRSLENIWIGQFKLRIHKARDGFGGGREASRKERKKEPFRKATSCYSTRDRISFSEVVRQGKEVIEPKLQEETEKALAELRKVGEDNTDFLSKSLMGNVDNLEDLKSLKAVCKIESLGDCGVKLLGGRNVLLKVDSEEMVENLLENKNHGIHFWLKNLQKWSRGYKETERIVWLCVAGVPLQAWSEESFRMIGKRYGKILKVINGDFYSSDCLDYGKMLVVSPLRGKIEEDVIMKVDGVEEEGYCSPKEWHDMADQSVGVINDDESEDYNSRVSVEDDRLSDGTEFVEDTAVRDEGVLLEHEEKEEDLKEVFQSEEPVGGIGKNS
ncbi:hypothetical protein OSB04_031362 [Centaurea solstitialis]|uniref:RRM domain-containing protein n=1 Tax=Centaurea solstitialis TaxID=347529 RepID=A0AA38SAL1_9ASTR|nr:hypothetical protein OSB04_031362 [Centaurea solstitialis]